MAIEDYFKGSSQAYGQLAGSLLAGRRKEDKKLVCGSTTFISLWIASQNKFEISVQQNH